MNPLKKTINVLVAMIFAATLPWVGNIAHAGMPTPADPVVNPGTGQPVMRSLMKSDQRKAAAARAAAARAATRGPQGRQLGAAPMTVPVPGGMPDYMGGIYPNYANSQLPTLNPVTGVITGGIKKFVDLLPGLGSGNANGLVTPGGDPLGQYIPIATPDTVTFPGCDYYEINLVEFTERMHSNLPAAGVKLRGYVQVNFGTYSSISGKANTVAPAPVHYLGPIIIARKDRPVRVKFTNALPLMSAGGNLFIPVDTTAMGAGTGPNTAHPFEKYTQNRAIIHLHGGATPWISDGTPHQWTTPANEATSYPRGVSVSFVPDMWFNPVTHARVVAGTPGATNDPGPGSLTFYYTNQQSARLMFYHDHAYGITRLNVYAGEAAGYLVTDQVEEDLISGTNTSGVNPGFVKVLPDLGGVNHLGIPLIIQDKTFVPDSAQLTAEDPTWNWGGTGNLWFPHVYMPNQDPADLSGANAMGRWDYGPWFWPPVTAAAGLVHGPVVDPSTGNLVPGTPNPSLVPEAFMDTPVVNGTAYPVLPVTRKAYRFRVLNACNDRTLNLQLYYADPVGATVINGGTGYSSTPSVAFSGGTAPGGGSVTTQATGAVAVTGIVNGFSISNGGSGYTSAPTVNIIGGGGANATAAAILTSGVVTGIAVTNGGAGYTTVPTVTIRGGGGSGAIATATITNTVTGIVITDPGSGYATAPDVVISDTTGSGAVAIASPNTEVRMVPAVEAANIPSYWPMMDGRAGGVPDPTTAGPDIIQIGTEGGFLPAPVVHKNTPVGYNYNRRDIVVLNVQEKTLMLGPAERADIIVDFSQIPAGVNNVILYNDAPAPVPAFDPRLDYYTGDPDQTTIGGAPTTLPGYGPNTRTVMQFQVSGSAAASYDLTALQTAWPAAYTASQDAPIVPQAAYGPTFGTTFTDTFSRIQDTSLTFNPVGSITPVTVNMEPKAIQELFELNYGRMNATLGVELPFTNFNIQTTIPLGYADPITETMKDGSVQIWKITHNGVDTHAIHFHLFNVQLINRVGWDGAIRPPEPNELGWKETVRMNPLEDCIVAIRPVAPTLPFAVPDSVRPLDVTSPAGAPITVTDTATGNPLVINNDPVNLGWEYVWHCHLLGHEENDMMRPLAFLVVPGAPVMGAAVAGNKTATVSFLAPLSTGGSAVTGYNVTSYPGPGGAAGVDANAGTTALSHTITGLTNGVAYTFKVSATNAVGTSPLSAASNSVTPDVPPVAPSGLAATVVFTSPVAPTVKLTWNDNSTNETGFRVQRAANSAFTAGVTTFLVGVNIKAYTDTAVLSNTGYYYRVCAYNSSGSSAWSSAVNVITIAAPSNFISIATRTGTTDSVRLTWTYSGTVSNFTVQSATNSAFSGATSTTVVSTARSFTQANLPRSRTYYYRIRTNTSAGSSAWSPTLTVTTP